MEQSVAAYLVQIDPSPSLFIIDCNPNMNYSLISNRAIPLIQFIRNNGHPTTPIIMTEGTRHGSDWYSNTSRVGRLNKTVALREAFNILVAAGDMHLYYSTAEDIYSDSLGMNPDVSGDRRFLVDPTVAGTHPTDLGMRKQAAWWTKTIPAILKADRACETTLRSPADAYAFETPQSKVLASAFPMPEENMRDDSNDVFTRRDSFQWIDGATFLRGISTFTDRDGGHVLPRVSPYQRLPQVAKKDVREQVWTLSEMSTGTYLRFASNASTIAINHTLAFPTQHLWHMPYTGTDGLDVYAFSRADKAWRHIPITKGIELCGVLKDKLISCENVTSSHAMMSGVFHKPEPVGQKESEQNTYWTYLVYLPLRNAPKELSVGVPSNALVCSKINEKSSQMSGIGDCKDAAPSFDENKPIVWYGTSIQQGGVASRAGNEYDAIISRALGVDIHNFGFAGNGKMELSVAKYLAMVPASVLIIDCLPNMDAASVTERTIPLVQFLRKNGHATTPIVLAEGTPYPAEWLNGSPYADTAKNEALKQAFDTLVGTLGVKGLYYVKGSDLFKSKLVNPTVGGVHSSDLGQYMIADYYVGFLPAVLAGKVESS